MKDPPFFNNDGTLKENKVPGQDKSDKFFLFRPPYLYILIGVASDYANKYPDAPNIWIRNHLGEIQEIGTTNIEKYSINSSILK